MQPVQGGQNVFSFLEPLRELSFASVTLRLVLAVLCGGLIGIERTYKRRPAGFRTHILICLGAALTTMTSQYLINYMHYYTDVARLGAQVIAGVGFIGAGAIIVTKRERVRGLTTAAGFWVAAIVGLAFGAGYYEGGVLTTALVIAVELVFIRIEYWVTNRDPEVSLYIEYIKKENLEKILKVLQEKKIRVRNLEVSQLKESNSACAIVSFRARSKVELYELTEELYALQGVLAIEEL